MESWLAIALDLGTSGLRGQALDLATGEILSTAITTRHPLVGDNVMDQLEQALERGTESVRAVLVGAINQVARGLRIPLDRVVRLAVCANPIQLSLLQGMEVRDLAWAGRRKVRALGVTPPSREGGVLRARDLPGLALPADCEVIIPPAIRHAVGADALALILKSGALEREETAIATDFGTNAEVALFHRGAVFTASTAAGPALEGQQIAHGMLAAPGAISDLSATPSGFRLVILDDELSPVEDGIVDLGHSGPLELGSAPRPRGVTGTGTIAIVSEAIEAGLVAPPRIRTDDRRLHLGEEISLDEEDLAEAGKAFGAIRAGHLTLCHAAGISPAEIRTACLSGAAGTYLDPLKAQRLGLLPPRIRTVFQIGNTSLAMARDLALDPGKLQSMVELAARLRREHSHLMFAAHPTFKKVLVLELARWTEGMPMSVYRQMLARYGLPDLPPIEGVPKVVRTVKRDIDDFGRMGLTVLPTSPE